MKPPARVIAFYLPQYHPIPENDRFWGTGFSEWRNVAKAQPLFPGHYQPHIPADLGFYDLRVPEARMAQADLARRFGIEAFCYWHYWLGGGRMLLQRPFEEVLASGEPAFPFCLGWANHSWTGTWFGAPNQTFIEQTYPGIDDHKAHFKYLLAAFADRRYLKVDGQPLFVIFRPREIPECRRVMDMWREMALHFGFSGLHIVGIECRNPEDFGCDSTSYSYHRQVEQMEPLQKGIILDGKPLALYSYARAMKYFLDQTENRPNVYPTIIPNWDSTPRLGTDGVVLHDATPELFGRHVREALEMIRQKPYEHRIVFAKSWNEWAEGNHLEPDLRYGTGHLEALKQALEAWDHKQEKNSEAFGVLRPLESNFELSTKAQPHDHAASRQNSYGRFGSSPEVTYATVKEYNRFLEVLPTITFTSGDLKNHQRPWVVDTILRRVPRGARLLEIGADKCELAVFLQKMGYSVWVVDQFDGLGGGTARFDEMKRKFPSLTIIKGFFHEVDNLPLNYFGAIYSCSVIEHTPMEALRATFDKIYRCLSNNGLSVHAIDFTVDGPLLKNFGFINEVLKCNECNVKAAEVAMQAINDVETFYLTPAGHQRWRKFLGKSYDQYPFRKVTSLNLVLQKRDVFSLDQSKNCSNGSTIETDNGYHN